MNSVPIGACSPSRSPKGRFFLRHPGVGAGWNPPGLLRRPPLDRAEDFFCYMLLVFVICPSAQEDKRCFFHAGRPPALFFSPQWARVPREVGPTQQRAHLPTKAAFSRRLSSRAAKASPSGARHECRAPRHCGPHWADKFGHQVAWSSSL